MSKKKRRVTIISRESDEKSIDISMLEEELRIRGIDVSVLCKLFTKEKSLKALGYIAHVIRQELEILRSDVVILDTYCIAASMFPHRKSTKIVQMWHALAAIKKFGWQNIGAAGGTSERTARLMKMHHGYDYVLSPSEITAEHFCEAFRVSEDKIVRLGLPRIDYIKSVTQGSRQAETAKMLYSRYPELYRHSEKKTILYAPTFRRGEDVKLQSLIETIDLDRYNLVVKMHPVYGEREKKILRLAALPQNDKNGIVLAQKDRERGAQCEAAIFYDIEFSSYDWLSVADIIISDYSAFVVEAALAEKPLYIYAYDLDEYEKSTGLNMNFGNEEIAKYTFQDAEELAKSLDMDYDFAALRSFKSKYVDIDTENCTGALADFIEDLLI
ncbi:MAG: CDP-glycerol glycerophosphotransferase family protein [Mogibacterium sp.]|nr:CDP-glycerol glycerophosphotransferase family protein [Mogibacterium sp.]